MKKSLYIIVIAMSSFRVYSQTFLNPEPLFDPAPYGFSHLASVPACTKLIFVAGQGGEENKDGKLNPDFRMQARQALRNIQISLATQSADMNAIVKVTTLVVDHDAEKLQIIVEEFEKMWPDKNFPVNTLIPVPRLAIDGMLVEIDAIAIIK